jgi:RNA polymerase sigma-70 factor (ECF subfamily)
LGNESSALMARVKAGDRTAFDALVERVRGRGYRVALALVGSREDALELCQEALMKVYQARATYREEEPFLPWFQRILRNACYSFLRRARVRARGEAHDEDEGSLPLEPPSPAPGPEHAVLLDERAELFWEAFRELAARDREILALRHFEERSYKEIAAELEIPEGTVMSRLFHARRRLRERLAGALDEEALPSGGGGAR